MKRSLGFVACFGVLLLEPKLSAQWATQTNQLQPGWNAVYLEVQPEPAASTIVFAGLPVESVWMWNRRFSPVEYIQDPSTLVPSNPDWLVYFPPGNPLEAQRNLYAIESGKCYLVRLRSDAGSVDWAIRGVPRPRRPEWLAGSYNLVGFSVSRNPAPRFSEFFAGFSGVGNFFRLDVNGNWARADLTAPAGMLRPGEAFWAFAANATDYSGPIRVTLDQRNGLDYGKVLQEQTVRIRNESSVARTVMLSLRDSEAATDGQAAVAGPVMLDYWDANLSYNGGGWRPFNSAIASPSLSPRGEWIIRLGVRRRDMARSGVSGSILEVSDSPASVRHLIPVTAEGIEGATGLARQGTSAGGSQGRAGLWVGSAVLRAVSRPASIPPNQLESTASEFQFRLIVHVDAMGKARLLRNVVQMWQDGAYKDAPHPIVAGQTVRTVDKPGRFVLVADDSLIPRFSGAAYRDGQPVGRRYSTVAFSFSEPQDMTGQGVFGQADMALACEVVLGYDDPLNPFVHRFHPHHDNLNERFSPYAPVGGRNGPETPESWTITRKISLRFTAEDPQALRQPGWGDNQIGGLYEETISGLHAQDLKVGGYFRLHHASDVAVLNDGL